MGGAVRSAMVGVVLVLAATLGAAQPRLPQPVPAEPSSEWAKGNKILLGVTQPRIGFSAQWQFQRSAAGDILLDLEETRAGRTRAGALLLLAEGVLLARDLPLERGREIDAIHGPLLMLQLTLRLLERSVPAGPAGLRPELKIDLAEPKKSLRVSAFGADGEFHAPWTLKGSIAGAAGGQVRLELEFVSAARARAAPWYETSIAGIWQNVSPPLQLPDGMPLRGWRVYQLKPVNVPQGAANGAGVGTSPPMAFANLGEVRSRAREWAELNSRRARWQCR
jgi:hypothetical protein